MELSLADLIRGGFSDLKVGFWVYDIWAKDDVRVWYLPFHDRVESAYRITQDKVKPISLERLNELIEEYEQSRLNHG